MTLPKLRIPTWGEVVALFHRAPTMDAALGSFHRSVAHLEHVADTKLAESAKHMEDAAAARLAAANSTRSAASAESEAARALRVSDNIKALVA